MLTREVVSRMNDIPMTPLALALALAASDLLALQQDDAQWVMPAKSYASTRYSRLGEINGSNVKSLKVAWTFSTGFTKGHEAAPLVVGKTMYVVSPYPNWLFALDLEKAGAIQWIYKPEPVPS